MPVLALMGFSLPAMAGLILGATAHALVWNSLHPAMHGMEDILSDGSTRALARKGAQDELLRLAVQEPHRPPRDERPR